ncbi:MAG: hypothetical protein ACI9AR_000459 [Flavobacteriaceae bacterium]|jgi:hypothetical protein
MSAECVWIARYYNNLLFSFDPRTSQDILKNAKIPLLGLESLVPYPRSPQTNTQRACLWVFVCGDYWIIFEPISKNIPKKGTNADEVLRSNISGNRILKTSAVLRGQEGSGRECPRISGFLFLGGGG